MSSKFLFYSFFILFLQQLLWCDTNSSVTKTLQLSPNESAYVKSLPVLRYSSDPDWMPYESFTADGSHIGVAADILKILTERSGIKLTKIRSDSWTQVIAWMKKGEIDLFSDTDDSVLNTTMAFTKPYLTDKVVIVSHDIKQNNLTPKDINNKRIAMVKDYGYVNAYIKRYPKLRIVWVKTVSEAFAAVQDGKADYTITSEYEAARMIFLKFDALHIAGDTKLITNLAFAFNPKYKAMVPIFNKAIDSLTDEDRIKIKNKWMPSKIEGTDYTKLIYVTLFFIGLLFIGAYAYRKLKKELQYRKALELELMREKNNFETLFTKGADANNILVNGKFVVCNQSFLDLLNIKEENVIGQTPEGLSPEYQPDGELSSVKANNILKNMMSKGKIRFEWVHQTTKGTPVWCDIVLTKIIHNGKVGVYAQIRNIDDIKMLEESLRLLKIKAEQANIAKSQFLANMSHEIRTPMNAVIGFTELLAKSDGLASIQMNYVRSIKNGAKNLLAIINDILDLSKIEAGKIQLQVEPFESDAIIEDMRSVFTPIIMNKNLEFKIVVDPNLPTILFGDDVRLRQILFNLLGNAIKFTEKGEISLVIIVNEINTKTNLIDVSFKIIDTGIGISADNQLIVFKEFEQSDNQSTRKYGGTGLGLTISRKLAEAMNGVLSVESKEGEGSCFTLHFPSMNFDTTNTVIGQASSLDTKVYTFEKAMVLLVDDIEDNLLLLHEMLNIYPFELFNAKNGQEALELMEHHNFNLVITDIRMPVMDGKMFLLEMKKNEKWKNIPVIAVTASVFGVEKHVLNEYGFSEIVLKPYNQNQMESVISKFLPYKIETTQNKKMEFEENFILSKNIQILYKEAFGDRIQREIRRNNFSELAVLVNDLKIFLQKNPDKDFEKIVDVFERSINEFDIVGVDSSLKILNHHLS